ncbi:unnamed protein product [Parajaminaea phylloscopi]
MADQFVGKPLPNTTFVEVPFAPELESLGACGVPQTKKVHDLFKGKKVVIISIPGSFTPTCHVNHIPPFIQRAKDFEAKGYEVYVIAQNDAFVQSAFGRVSGAKGDIHFASDFNLEFSQALSATVDMTSKGFGVRGSRYIVVANDNVITHFAVEPELSALQVSGVDQALVAAV